MTLKDFTSKKGSMTGYEQVGLSDMLEFEFNDVVKSVGNEGVFYRLVNHSGLQYMNCNSILNDMASALYESPELMDELHSTSLKIQLHKRISKRGATYYSFDFVD